jgi:hypothetical protein
VSHFYYGGARGYREGDIIRQSDSSGGLIYSKDIEQAALMAAKHTDGNELHGGTVYRVSPCGPPHHDRVQLKVLKIVTPNISRAPYLNPGSVMARI